MNSLAGTSPSDPSALSDEQLMQGFADGDSVAFDVLYHRHKDSLYRFFLRQSDQGRFDEGVSVDDLFQELWGRVINASARYQVQAKWTTWVYRIATHLVIDHKRAMKPLSSIHGATSSDVVTEPYEDHTPDVSNAAIASQLHDDTELPEDRTQQLRLAERLKFCIHKLPSAQQQVFVLSEETGLTLREISEVVDASLEAIKSRMRYARQQLQQCLNRFKESKE